MTLLFFLLDVPAQSERIARDPWVPLILVSMIALFLAAGFAAGLIFLLIRVKRRKLKQAAEAGEVT